MSNPLNLYCLSKIQDPESFQIIVDQHNSNLKAQRIKEEEQISLKKFVERLLRDGLKLSEFDGFYFNYKIPQIEKEFDILKVKNGVCLNIELKSHSVSYEKMFKQQKKNRLYLKALQCDLKQFTVITETMEVFCLDEFGLFEQSSFGKIIEQMKALAGETEVQLDSLFKVTDYLISPLNNPKEFLQQKYFLTDDQSRIKNEILRRVEGGEKGFVILFGNPGTGKTLLLYDIAVSLSKNIEHKVLMVHSGILSNGHFKLNELTDKNFEILSAKELTKDDLDKAVYVFVDEAHRMYPSPLHMICETIRDENSCLFGVFSLDPGQVLSWKEKYYQNDEYLKNSANGKIAEYTLKGKIRTNEELQSFVLSLFNLDNAQSKKFDYKNVDVVYVTNTNELNEVLKYYQGKGYVAINFSKSNRNPTSYDSYIEDKDTHHVIGLEYDNVVIPLNSTFYYDENKKLAAVRHPNPDYRYTKLLYQAITRARKKLALVICDAPKLYSDIVSIFKKK